MEKKSIVITTGAMATALFGVMMWLNRQSGNLFQEIFIFLYPIPMVAYAALYGLRNGAAVCASMSLLAFLLGDFITIFYALTQAVIGLVFGSCLHHKVDMTKTLLTIMLLSAFVNLLNTVFLGFLFGIDINREVAEIQGMMKAMFEQTGQAAPENIMSLDSLKQIFIVSMILSGFLQGFIVYEVSLLLLRRLRFHVQKPKSVFLYTPPVWTGYVALLAFMVTNRSLIIPYDNIHLDNLYNHWVHSCVYTNVSRHRYLHILVLVLMLLDKVIRGLFVYLYSAVVVLHIQILLHILPLALHTQVDLLQVVYTVTEMLYFGYIHNPSIFRIDIDVTIF